MLMDDRIYRADAIGYFILMAIECGMDSDQSELMAKAMLEYMRRPIKAARASLKRNAPQICATPELWSRAVGGENGQGSRKRPPPAA